jgi:hypothetical protein
VGPAPAVDLVAVLPGVVAPWLGASRFVAGASDLAARVGIPPFVVGLTVVALGTSLPEFAVTVGSASAGRTDVSVASVVGSNVINLGIVLGGSAAVRALPTSGGIIRRDGPGRSLSERRCSWPSSASTSGSLRRRGRTRDAAARVPRLPGAPWVGRPGPRRRRPGAGATPCRRRSTRGRGTRRRRGWNGTRRQRRRYPSGAPRRVGRQRLRLLPRRPRPTAREPRGRRRPPRGQDGRRPHRHGRAAGGRRRGQGPAWPRHRG